MIFTQEQIDSAMMDAMVQRARIMPQRVIWEAGAKASDVSAGCALKRYAYVLSGEREADSLLFLLDDAIQKVGRL